jgi:hypothetical protein
LPQWLKPEEIVKGRWRNTEDFIWHCLGAPGARSHKLGNHRQYVERLYSSAVITPGMKTVDLKSAVLNQIEQEK